MAARAGTAFIEVRGDFSPFDKQVGRLAVTSRSRFARIGKVAAAGVAAGFAGGAVVVRKAMAEWVEAEKVSRQTAAALKSTGGQANVTARQIEALASSISRKAGIDDEAIQSAENLLLTFTKVRNETGQGNKIFGQATKAIVDMSAAMDQDLKSSTIQVGKALNDPIKGMTALQRVGVSFTQQQKDRVAGWVEEGNVLRAQKFILKELRTEFGGSAAAQATGFDRAKVAIDNMAESLGGFLGPKLEQAANQVARFVNQIQTGRGAGGEFAREVKEIWTNAQPVVVAFARAGAAVAKFAAQHPNITKVATAVGLTALAFNKFKIAGAISAISSVVKVTSALPGRMQNALSGVRALMSRILGRAGTAGGAALAENAAATAAANVPGRFSRKAGVFRNAGTAVGRGAGIAAGATMATQGVDQIAGTMERSAKSGRLARSAKVVGRALGGILGPALAGAIAQIVLRELNKRVNEWARENFGGAGSAYGDAKDFLGRNFPEGLPGGPIIREVFKRRGGIVGWTSRPTVGPPTGSTEPRCTPERAPSPVAGAPASSARPNAVPAGWAAISADTVGPSRQLWHPIRACPLPRFRAGGVVPAPVTFPLLGDVLDPLMDDALLGGIQAGYDRTGARGRRKLLAQLLETIVPESGDRATRRRPTSTRRRVEGRRVAGGRIRPGGGYAGTENIVKTAVAGFTVTNLKRTPSENAAVGGSPTSDHLTTKTNAYAADYTPGDGPFNVVKRRLRIPAKPGTWTRHKIPGIRYVAQMLWKVEDHHDHNHLGVERMRRGGTVGPGFDFPRWLRGLRKQDRQPTLVQLVSILGADQLGTRNADAVTRVLARRVQGRSIGALVAGQKRIKDQIRRMARDGFTGPERIRTRRLRGGLSLLQDEMGRPIGRTLGASDRLQERIGRAESRIQDELIVSGIDPESAAGLQAQRGLAERSLGKLGTRRAQLEKALARARRTGNKPAIRQVQAEIREVDDQMLSLRSSIVQLDKTMQQAVQAQRDRLAEATEENNRLLAELAGLKAEANRIQQEKIRLAQTQGPELLASTLMLWGGDVGGTAGPAVGRPRQLVST